MMLWGHKTLASFDVWSIEHFITGISIAFFANIFVNYLVGKEKVSDNLKLKISFITTLLVAYFWEATEHYLETGLLGEEVKYWFAGVEHWSNRLIADNLMILAGWITYNYYNNKYFLITAKIFSVVWLLVHIFIFSNSMFLHESGLL